MVHYRRTPDHLHNLHELVDLDNAPSMEVLPVKDLVAFLVELLSLHHQIRLGHVRKIMLIEDLVILQPIHIHLLAYTETVVLDFLGKAPRSF
jgi:hypothetical protein